MSEVWLRAPPRHLFQFPPAADPQALPSPQRATSFTQPFNIDPVLYNAVLDVRVPLTIATVYAVTVGILNKVNRQRGHKPWAVSRTRVFFALVILHNVFLAVYSAWTHIGMINAIMSIWPGWHGPESLPDIVDALCKMQGPRGLGDAVSYDPTSSKWGISNSLIKLSNNQPDSTDVGRLWNEGLAFYGWLFYLSKFYEVVDTLVILAKGKRSSFLQTYHHAGAMLCMWAGIRYMSPPIWMFCWINSGIHALMYTYYTLSALGVKVPSILKRTLTSMQITQFLIGFTFAIMHLFVAYKIPIQSPYTYYHNLSTALPSATSAVASAVATADIGSWLKKAILRAAGDEGLSSNVRNQNGRLFGHSGQQAVLAESNLLAKTKEEVRYRLEFGGVSCIDTSGQAFAIYLNLLYLVPLTMLFLRFFLKSYLRKPSSGKLESQARRWSKSGYDAAKGVEKEVVKAMRRDRGSALTSPAHSDAEASSQNGAPRKHKNNLSMTKIIDQLEDKTEDLTSKGVNGIKQISGKAKETDAPVKLKDSINKTADSAKQTADNVQAEAANKAKDVAAQLKEASEDQITDSAKEGEDSEALKTPSKKKKKNRNKNKGHDVTNQDSSAHDPETYAEAAAIPPTSENNDIVAGEGEKIIIDETGASETTDPMARSYETSIDEITTTEQKEAEAELQHEGVSKS